MPNKAMRPFRVLRLALALAVGFVPATALAQDHVAGSANFIKQMAENAVTGAKDRAARPFPCIVV